MLFLYILTITVMLVWLIPPFKQYKTKYFYYFLCSALSGPLFVLISYLFKININYFNPAFYMLLLSSIVDKKHLLVTLPTSALLAVVMPGLHLSNVPLFGISFIIALMVFLKMVLSLLELFIKTQLVNLFLILLLLNFSTSLFKILAVVLNFEQGIISYHIGAFVQLFFGVAFWFIDINTKSFKVPLKGFEPPK